jgi:hypothetical protein
MGPANCRGLLKFAMSSIAACALDASIARPAATAQRLVFMEPSLADRYDREEFWGRQLPIAFVRQNTKNFARLSSARGRRILGRVVGQFFGVSDAIRRYRGQETASFWGPFKPAATEREERDLSWDTMLHVNECRQRAYGNPERGRCSGRGPGLDRSDGGAIKRRLRCRQPSPSLSPRR